jgi:4-hydroxybenzoate polyprenyltransferase
VHLDGAVIRTDIATESLLALVKRNLLYLFVALYWLARGRAVLKEEVAKRMEINPATLPYNQELLSWLAVEQRAGRRIWLCTGANVRMADRIARHLQLFTGVIASDSRTNLDGPQRARRLVQEFGYREFDYCGSDRSDLFAWQCSHGVVTVCSQPTIEEQASRVAPLLHAFPRSSSVSKSLWRALRPHQWAKNILVFVPLLAAHRIFDMPAVAGAGLAFLAFCLCASSVYILNDMLDLEADRAHVSKSRRPFASGDLSLAAGFWLLPALLGLAALTAWLLPWEFAVGLGAYFALTLAYSFRLKGIPLLDTTALASLYTIRIVAGGYAISTPPSFWLLLFSVFLFLSLAFVKRYAELEALQRVNKRSAAGRSYDVQDLPLLESLGIAAGYMSVIVLALYINSPAVEPLYSHPRLIWILCVLLLYWISRIWMKTHRGRMNEDPVLFALRDRVSLATGAIAAVVLGLAV